jgi:hypothetical protein
MQHGWNRGDNNPESSLHPAGHGVEDLKLSAGYSGTPLYKKLGLRPDLPVWAPNLPPDVRQLLEAQVPGIRWLAQAKQVDGALLFATHLSELRKAANQVRKPLMPAGFIWVCWPKKASGVPTDVTEDRIRELALSIKLVDVKVCAVTEIWSGLKLVIRLKDRK